MTEVELLKTDLRDCDAEIAAAERRLYQLEALRRQLEHDIAEADTAQDQTREWGTKWDITDAMVLSEDDLGDGMLEVVMAFDTAWSPPIECFETWFGENEDCDCVLDYHEPGIAFVGRFSPEWGENTYEYGEATADTVRKLVPEDLVDHWDLEQYMLEMESE